MAPKLFLTGATGYIGGDVLYALNKAHPDYEITCMIRTQEKADIVTKAYPNIHVVLGSNDDSELLEAEAAKADIVIHTADASDHEGAARAIAAGLQKGHSATNPGYWIHTSGNGILTYLDAADDYAGLGKRSDKQFDDLDGVAELTHLPDDAFHRNVDKVVLACGSSSSSSSSAAVKTVVLCPPTIYGRGRGPVAARSRQAYEMAKLILTERFIPVIGEGQARWNSVHVGDLADLYVLLAERAAAGDASDEVWGEKGYMFTAAGEHSWSELARLMGRKAEELGYCEGLKEGSLSKDEALEQAGFEAVSWGLNSRGRALRARKFVGWDPKRPSLEDEVPNILREERARLEKA